MPWTLDQLHELTTAQEDWVVEREEDFLTIANDEGIEAFLYAGDQQIIVESILFPLSAVKEPNNLNELVLQTHQIVPLSTVGISSIGSEKYYVAFGALSSASKAEVLIEEIEALFGNVPEFIELYEEHLTTEEVA